ncbi:MAG: hypothetical protein KDD69_01820 [Bdellovibrionales bacterium]|nr:hypothetical protein [Bdellovibrionales bacterium]
MDHSKSNDELPAYLLDSLEDASQEILELQELMLALAASAQDIEDRLPAVTRGSALH